MRGKILGAGIIRAEDGKRYTFELADIQNLANREDLEGLEIDFEPQDSKALDIFILKQAKSAHDEPQAQVPQSFCEEVNIGASLKKHSVFYGIVDKHSENTVSQSFGNISGGGSNLSGGINAIKGHFTSALSTASKFKLGDKTFKMGESMRTLTPLIGMTNPAMGVLSSFLNQSGGNIEPGDKILVLATEPRHGFYEAIAIKNFTKAYCQSQLKQIIWFSRLLKFFVFIFLMSIVFILPSFIPNVINGSRYGGQLTWIIVLSIFVYLLFKALKIGKRKMEFLKIFQNYEPKE